MKLYVCTCSWSKTVGVFWHNAAETWIDITNSAANKVTAEFKITEGGGF